MRKIKSLVFSLALVVILILLLNYTERPQRESVQISDIVDGDTLKTADGRTLRLANINSPEKNTPGYEQSILFLNSFENQIVEIEPLGYDMYDRLLVRIYAPEYLNIQLVREGLASKFLVHDSELNLFAEAEKSAITSSKGIWTKSPYFGCFESDLNFQSEIVTLRNSCNTMTLFNWTLKDESRKRYIFKPVSVGSLRLHSSEGTDNSSDVFWQSNTNVWNNDRDSLYLFDSQGRIAHYETYGY